MQAEKVLCTVALVLVIVGALNWGAHALGHGLVAKVLGDGQQPPKVTTGELIVYSLVALAGVVVAVQLVLGKIVVCPDSQ